MSIVHAVSLVAGYISLPESARAELEQILTELEIPEPVPPPVRSFAAPAASSEETVSPVADPSRVDAVSSEPINPQVV